MIRNEIKSSINIQLDSASTHYSCVTQYQFNDNYPGRWNGRNGPIISRPPRYSYSFNFFYFHFIFIIIHVILDCL